MNNTNADDDDDDDDIDLILVAADVFMRHEGITEEEDCFCCCCCTDRLQKVLVINVDFGIFNGTLRHCSKDDTNGVAVMSLVTT